VQFLQVTGLTKQARSASGRQPERILRGRTVTEPDSLPQAAGEPGNPDIAPSDTGASHPERAAAVQSTLRMMEQRVHTMRQTSRTGLADGTSDFRSEVHVGVKRIVVSDLPAPLPRDSRAGQGALLTVMPALILGVATGIGAALVASVVDASAVVVGLCYGLPVVTGLLLTILRNARHRRK
jgi:hypothetical protein